MTRPTAEQAVARLPVGGRARAYYVAGKLLSVSSLLAHGKPKAHRVGERNIRIDRESLLELGRVKYRGDVMPSVKQLARCRNCGHFAINHHGGGGKPASGRCVAPIADGICECDSFVEGSRRFSRRTQGQRSRTETTSEAGDAAPTPGPLCPSSSGPPQHARTAGLPAASLSPSGGSCRGRRGARVHRPRVPRLSWPPVPHVSFSPVDTHPQKSRLTSTRQAPWLSYSTWRQRRFNCTPHCFQVEIPPGEESLRI